MTIWFYLHNLISDYVKNPLKASEIVWMLSGEKRSWLRHCVTQKSSSNNFAIFWCLGINIVWVYTSLFRGSLICIVVMVFANASTLSTLILISETFSIRSNSLYTFNATKHIWASMRLRVKWNMGRISIFDFAIRKPVLRAKGCDMLYIHLVSVCPYWWDTL